MSKHLQKFSSFQSFQKEQQASNRLLYVYRNSVYDLTDFADRHPGGRAALNIYKGRDLENIFFNSSIHKHSTHALQVLQQYKCGIIEIKQQSSIFNSKSTNFTTSFVSKKPQIQNDTKTQPIKKTPLKSQSVKPKPSHNEDRLNQSMNNLNQSMTSSVKSHFLHIPSQMEIIQLQKQKQKQLIQTWKQTEIDELKRQQAEVLKLQQEKNQMKDDRKVQSEIISTQKKSISPFYQAWLDKKKNQLNETSTNNILPSYLTQSNRQDDESTFQNDTQNYQQKLSQSVIIQKQQKKVNPYYEEWKRKQAQKEHQNIQEQLQQSIIMEENESQLSGQPSSVNNSFQRSFSLISQRTIVQEDPHLYVPVFSPKFISPLKAKFYHPISNLNLKQILSNNNQMQNPIFNAAKAALTKQLKIEDPILMYKHFLKSPFLCSNEMLKKETHQELFNKIIFLGGFHERRNCGVIIKEMIANCFRQYRNFEPALDISNLVQLFLTLSNVLLYDDKLICFILNQLKSKQDQIQIKQLQSISHCLYKLGIKDQFWPELMHKNVIICSQVFGIQDLVQHIHIASNQVLLSDFQEEKLFQLLEILQNKFMSSKKHIYLSKFQYQFTQLMFNLYPELIMQKYDYPQCNKDNKYRAFFDYFCKDYQICRMLLDRKENNMTVDYFENDNFPNLIRTKDDVIEKKISSFESNIEQLIKKLNLKYKYQQKVAIYEIDFFVEDKFLINCNGPTHFIQNLDKEVLRKSPNWLMQQRHLKQLDNYQIIDLDFQIWDQYDTSDKYTKEFKKLLNLM
ncbi:unnamed protein product (macronuclear) [Paramecium tetraurelia]|uniref:Cytochrome b5 heme-binding domain-containing protein n=1 Tax=Paramecium tetraurelia TaxID=5888 RepID=A0DGF6_PARTE|nr:uncharacterized protein GSPATT00002252001 [Paramecium tetraurelia]CAK82123.1 unnamed protein product [Paramecium tetraurelia]|eukprot:XP_001449520.1 hypothetical protein (macronuclear) [Paramecium tetraurelia strain d4-2]